MGFLRVFWWDFGDLSAAGRIRIKYASARGG